MLILAIALGSALGGVSRYLLGSVVQRWAGDAFPLHTLLINISGSFLLGLLYRYGAESGGLSPEWRGLLMIGFCGGYTTFSAFSLETVRLIESGMTGRALAYVGLSVVLSVGATFAGMVLGKR
jgi:CrcB protein